MPSVKDIYPDTYLKPEHLQGKICTVTIEAVCVDNFYNPRSRKYEPALVVRMKRKKLPFILNKTQTWAVVEVVGDEDYSSWPGGKIRLCPGVAPNGKPTIVVQNPTSDSGPPPPPVEAVHPDADNSDEVHPDSELVPDVAPAEVGKQPAVTDS